MHIMDSDKIKIKTPTNSIVVWRIVFSYEIVIYHFLNAYNKSTSLHLATEFFFVVSGYILAMEMNKQKFDSSWSLLISRLKRYAPHYYLSLLFEFLVLFLHDKTRYKMFDLISGLFFLQGVGLNVNQWINVPTWYLSVLLLGDFFLYYLLQHHKTILENFLLPAIIIVVYVKQYNTNGYLSHGLGATGIYWNSALFLGIATMGAGVLLYKASNYAIKYISNRRIVSRIVEGGVFFGVIMGGLIWRKTAFDFLALGLIFIGCLIAFSMDDCVLSHNKLVKFFSSLSFPLFLNHNMFRILWPEYFTCSIMSFIIYIIVVTLYSVATMFMVNAGGKYIKQVIRRLY